MSVKENVLLQKQAVVKEIEDKIDASDSIVLMEYKGLTVADATELRSKFREAGVEYKVYKNTMMRFAFENKGYDALKDLLQGPNAVAFSPAGDPVSAAKVANAFAKDNEAIVIKAGVVNGQVIGVEEVKNLAELPSKETLLAMLLSAMQGPVRGLAVSLNETVSGLARALNQVAQQKEA